MIQQNLFKIRKSGFQIPSGSMSQNQNLSSSTLVSAERYHSRQTPIAMHRKSLLGISSVDQSSSQLQKKIDITADELMHTSKNNHLQSEFNNKNENNRIKPISRKSEGEIELNQIYANKLNGSKPLTKGVKDSQSIDKFQNKDQMQQNVLRQKETFGKSNSSISPFNEVNEGNTVINASPSNIHPQSSIKSPQALLKSSSTSTALSYNSAIRSQSMQLNTIQSIKQSYNISNSNSSNQQLKSLVNLKTVIPQSSIINSARDLESKENKALDSTHSQNAQSSDQLSCYKGHIYDSRGNMKQFEILCQVKTRAGQYSPNLKKINQDQSITQFAMDKSYSIFGVCDGHGEYGHLASNFVKKNLPKVIQKLIKSQGGWQNQDINLQKIITKSFQTVSNDLLSSKVDTTMSGTTAVTVLIHNNTLWCSNCGDSRAILGREQGRGSKSEWKSIPLSEDHKPDLPREKKRILEYGGRVEKSRDENGTQGGIFRVWNQTMEGPGLAMARSLGDKAGRDVGIISDPDIYEILIKEDDRFIVIASDGVWEFLTNTDVNSRSYQQFKSNNAFNYQVVKIIIPFYKQNDPQGAAEAIIKQSVLMWQKNDDNVIDDITCVVLFFKFSEDSKKRVFEYC